jgi:sulfur carrier protein ThiS
MAKQAKKNKKQIVIDVARFGHETVTVRLDEGATVEDAIEKAGINLAGTEAAYVDGSLVSMDDELENDDVLSIVTPKQAGTN